MKRCLQNNFFSFCALSVVFVCTIVVNVCGQVANYKFSQSNGTYTAVTGGTTIAAATDPAGTGLAELDGINIKTRIPFTFRYNNVNYDTCYVSEDGYISFGNEIMAYGYPINSSTSAGGVIAAMGADLLGCFSTSGITTNGSPIITDVAAFNGIAVGKLIGVSGIPAGATIVSFNTTAKTITVSANATNTYTSGVPVRWVLGQIKTQVTGTSPNRKFIIDYQNMSDNGLGNAINSSAFSFQIQLEETTNKINFVYGPYVTLVTSSIFSRPAQVGLRGKLPTDFNNRAATTGWAATTAGTSNTASVTRLNTIFPANGLTFTWQPGTCSFPADMGFTSVSATGATLSWSVPAAGVPAGYQWEVRTAGLPGSGATGLFTSGTTTSNSISVTGLSAGTTYNCYLRTDCGGGDLSEWSSAMILKTPCSGVQNTPYKENFNAYTLAATLPGCWAYATGKLTTATRFSAYPPSGITWSPTSTSGHMTADGAQLLMSSTTLQGEWLLSPFINIGTAGDKKVEFDFWLTNGSLLDTKLDGDDTLALVISTDGITWSKANVLQMWTAANTPYTRGRVSIKLPGYTGTVRFGFYGCETVFNSIDILTIDNFVVKDSACVYVDLGKDMVFCDKGGRTDTLNAGTFPGATYAWDDLSTGQKRVINASGNYSVGVTRNGCTERDTIKVTYGGFPVSKLGNDTTICGTNSIVLAPGNTGDVVWWVNQGITNATMNITQSGVYVVDIMNAAMCTTRDTISIKLIPKAPYVNFGKDTTICSGTPLILDIDNPGLTYLWNDNSTSQTRTVSASGTYAATVTDNDGCKSSDTIVVTVLQSPQFGNIVTTLTGVGKYSFSLTGAQNVNAYSWNFGDGTPNSTTASAVHQYTTNGKYNVIVTVTADGGCTYSDTIEINVGGVGIETYENAQAGIVLYPNPAHGVVHITYPQNLEQKQFAIYNVAGKKMLSSNFNANGAQAIDISAFAPGIYCLFIVGDNNAWPSYKFVVSDN